MTQLGWLCADKLMSLITAVLYFYSLHDRMNLKFMTDNNDGSIMCFCLFLLDLAAVMSLTLFMVTLCNRADHYIFILFLLSSSSFFPRLISAVADWMSTILPHMVWP